MPELNRVLYDAYGGFADKRVKDLSRSLPFIVDARTPGDIGATGEPNFHFCRISATALSDSELKIVLFNVPISDAIGDWAEKNGGTFTNPLPLTLVLVLERGQQERLLELAKLMRAIVATGAPRYSEARYKYQCPLVAGSLEKLKRVVDTAWTPGSTGSPRTASLFDT